MKDGFVRVAAGTPAIRAGDCEGNARAIVALMEEARAAGAKALALPEMCAVGRTAGDLLLQRPLLRGAEAAVEAVVRAGAGSDLLVCFGAPLARGGRLYSCAVVAQGGRALGVVPKARLTDCGLRDEPRHFAPAPEENGVIRLLGEDVPFGAKLLFPCEEMPGLVFAVAAGADLWSPASPAAGAAAAGATVLMCPLAEEELVGRAGARRRLLETLSAQLACACVCANAGEGESSTDLVFAGRGCIAESGRILAEAQPYEAGLVCADIDVGFLDHERRRGHPFGAPPRGYASAPFHVRMADLELRRAVDPMPFVPADSARRAERCEEVLSIQAHGLAARLRHIHAQKAVLAVSGGLDSTLALLVAARAFDLCGLPRGGILAVTMPCFGTTGRTRSNAQVVSERLGAAFREIRIEAAVLRHFADIGHNPDARDVTYENSQARERTQVLMDIANQVGGVAVGTGDLSELALGWATYNGDHMSMYGVNASVPKTLVRHLVSYEADRAADARLAAALRDILATPVSPELLPPVGGEIAQKTEDLVGPYELHDFFLYHLLRRGETAEKTARLARVAFAGQFAGADIDKWLRVFARRFFSQQFKRSCMPDGPAVGSVGLSPRGALRMPSDAVGALWQLPE